MPSLPHEVLLELFRRRPTLAAEILGAAVAPSLPYVQIADTNLTAPLPVERTADLVLLFSPAAGAPPAYALVVEVQLDVDPDKRRSWWWYLVGVHARHRCDALLVVVAPTARVAAWASQPIALGHPGVALRPLVVGPDSVPVVRDASVAMEAPEVAVLSAIVHGRGDAAEEVARAAFAAVHPLDDERARLYTDVIIRSLKDSARAALEELMSIANYEYQSDFAKRYVAEGRAEGRAEGEARGRAEGEARGRAEGEARGRAEGEARAVVAVLEARGVAVSDEVRTRIFACSDTAQLERWLVRAVTAKSAGEAVAD